MDIQLFINTSAVKMWAVDFLSFRLFLRWVRFIMSPLCVTELVQGVYTAFNFVVNSNVSAFLEIFYQLPFLGAE